MEKFRPYAFSFLAGVVYSSGFPTGFGSGLLITQLFGMGMLLYTLLKPLSFKSRVLHTISFCLSYNIIGFYWVADTLAEFGQLPYIVALLLSLFFTFIIAPHLWIFTLGTHLIYKKGYFLKFIEQRFSLFALLAAFLFTFIEYFTPQQFPVMIGQPWAKLGDYLGWAPIGGIPYYSFFSYLLIMEGIGFVRYKKVSYLNIVAVFAFVVSNPLLKKTPEPIGKDLEKLNVRLVQANISNFLKVDSEKGGYASVSQVLKRYRDLSQMPYDKGNLDLIVWPETAYPYAMQSSKEVGKTQVPTLFQDLALRHDSSLFVGGYDSLGFREDYFQSEYNSNFHINSEGEFENVYHKHILIPFGETLPFGPLNKTLSKYIDNISFFSEGKSFPVFKIETGHTFINTICYEILKPEFLREYLNSIEFRPHALINLTNDSWYGDTSEPEQHLFLTTWRALELNLPIIRSTNTGISSFINVNGQEVKRLGVGVTGNLDLELKLARYAPTIFQRYGFWALMPVWLALFIFQLVLIRLRR
ncbi:MAG: apolipoprotein N-acyltransferase [Halobacteriovoraceae bacterium]|nr:apolipoprotein N-acyltransferase [Halobacteriovoraceae bacterium]|tara:strand:- start:49323 stop:50903 length:1581 start_codon:yes stop_codon:yes gene_type:complete